MNFKQLVGEEKNEFSKIFAYEEVKGLAHHEILNFLDQAMTKAAMAVVDEMYKATYASSPSIDSENYSDSVTELECFQDGFDDALSGVRKKIESLKQQLSESDNK